MNVKWFTCKRKSDDESVKCGLKRLSLNNEDFDSTREGNYIIWNPENNDIVYVGRGNLHERINAHTKDEDPVQKKYGDKDLLVTYAVVDEEQHGGVENYLANLLNPKVGERWSEDNPIEVNLPDWPPFDAFEV